MHDIGHRLGRRGLSPHDDQALLCEMLGKWPECWIKRVQLSFRARPPSVLIERIRDAHKLHEQVPNLVLINLRLSKNTVRMTGKGTRHTPNLAVGSACHSSSSAVDLSSLP